jgi:hypothetical protein
MKTYSDTRHRRTCYTRCMRYHKVKRITRPEADYIINSPTSSLNECVVVEVDSVWYDVRLLTQHELNDFVDNLRRERDADSVAGFDAPH